MTKNITAQTDLAMTNTYANVSGFYFIAAHTVAGTRFYSNPIATFEEAEHIFSQYVDVINYFEGGYVEMYQIHEDDYDIISCIHI